MSSMEIHQAGISLERMVARTDAKLTGKDAFNHADYYDYDKGIYDGIASTLEAIQGKFDSVRFRTTEAGTPRARADVFSKSAADVLRSLDPNLIDPNKNVELVTAMVRILGLAEALYQHCVGYDGPDQT